VHYRDLISPFRALAREKSPRSLEEKFGRALAAQTVPYPGRFRAVVRAARVGKVFRSWMPAALRAMLDLLPPHIPPAQTWPVVTPAVGTRRARVALLAGCAQRVLEPDINTATIEVLTRNGVEVVVPRGQACCGGLAWHAGDLAAAQAFARRNLEAFPCDVDAIVTNAAGCGSAMREYHLILRGTAEEREAEAFRKRVVDVSVFLSGLGLREKLRGFGRPVLIAYQDACHLANAQNVRREPRTLLQAIPGVELCELRGGDLCCGSAGTYNLDQPKIAASLGAQKAKAAMATGAEIVATGNIGCLTQMRFHLAKLGSVIQVRHTMQMLRDAAAPHNANDL
jgi:glycolate oxidase iron-sulfur subunit